MNIAQATKQIKGAVRAYLSRDARGAYRIPFHMQRPLIVLGPPGVGKTAIVAQVAQEFDINFVSYSITHHTRQSALGLPFIEERNFGGKRYRVSEYTMSEIIGAVYHAQEESGVEQGILFLDEINCVSETLMPALLQFLQYKTFGMHALPEGWIIVTAGNPPEYNRAAHEFDPALMDRLKRIDVEPDLNVWQEYAATHGVHPAVTTFLDNKPASFYKVQASVQGTRLVTPRGWEDLSRMLQAYEAEEIEVDEDLVHQYLQDGQTAREFTSYYELFCKYETEYCVSDIVHGESAESVAARAGQARFDERIALMGMLQDAILLRVHDAIEREEALTLVRSDLLACKDKLEQLPFDQGAQCLGNAIQKISAASTVGTRERGQAASAAAVKAERLRVLRSVMASVSRGVSLGAADGFQAAKAAFNEEVAAQGDAADVARAALDNAFSFVDQAFGADSQEALILVTKLSSDALLIKFVSEYGSYQFIKHNKSLLFAERGLDLMQAVEALRAEEELTMPQGPFYTVD